MKLKIKKYKHIFLQIHGLLGHRLSMFSTKRFSRYRWRRSLFTREHILKRPENEYKQKRLCNVEELLIYTLLRCCLAIVLTSTCCHILFNFYFTKSSILLPLLYRETRPTPRFVVHIFRGLIMVVVAFCKIKCVYNEIYLKYACRDVSVYFVYSLSEYVSLHVIVLPTISL